MPDRCAHAISAHPLLIKKLTDKLQALINDSYWPKYLWTAKIVPLSKDNRAYTTTDQVRTISVIPVVAKLIERLILNRMEERLYGTTSGILDDCKDLTSNNKEEATDFWNRHHLRNTETEPLNDHHIEINYFNNGV